MDLEDQIDNMQIDPEDAAIEDVAIAQHQMLFLVEVAQQMRDCMRRNKVKGIVYDLLDMFARDIEKMVGNELKESHKDFFYRYGLHSLSTEKDWDEWYEENLSSFTSKSSDDEEGPEFTWPDDADKEKKRPKLQKRRYVATLAKPPGKAGEIESLRWVGYWLWTNRPRFTSSVLSDKEIEISKWTGKVNIDGTLGFDDQESFDKKTAAQCKESIIYISNVIGKKTADLLQTHALLGRYLKRVLDLNPGQSIAKLVPLLNQQIIHDRKGGKFDFLEERVCQRAVQLYDLIRPYPALLYTRSSVTFLLQIRDHLVSYFQVDPWYYSHWSTSGVHVPGKMTDDDKKILYVEETFEDPLFKASVSDTFHERGYVAQ